MRRSVGAGPFSPMVQSDHPEDAGLQLENSQSWIFGRGHLPAGIHHQQDYRHSTIRGPIGQPKSVPQSGSKQMPPSRNRSKTDSTYDKEKLQERPGLSSPVVGVCGEGGRAPERE